MCPGGIFITLEGGEGAGKSTQLALLQTALASAGLEADFTREPGGTAQSEAIRALIVGSDAPQFLPQTEALLVMAARMEHIERRIRPALNNGKLVVCDRFLDSTLVYQGCAQGLGNAWLQQLYRLVGGNLMPDLTLYLDIEPEAGLQRTVERKYDGESKFEAKAMAFHQTVREGFRQLAKASPERIVSLDAALPVETVHQQLIETLNRRFALGCQPVSAQADRSARADHCA